MTIPRILVYLLVAASAVMAATTLARAQSAAPLAQADVTGGVGWLIVDSGGDSLGGPRWTSTFHGAIAAGWYWTDHLKTEFEFGGGTEDTAFRSRPVSYEGTFIHRSSVRHFSRQSLAISQHYLFGRNAWVHPHVAVGAQVIHERSREFVHPLYALDPVTRSSRLVQPARQEPTRTDRIVSPFVAAGLKAYLAPRAYFHAGARASFRGGLDEVALRFGFGVDLPGRSSRKGRGTTRGAAR